jgi:hypothetical protein
MLGDDQDAGRLNLASVHPQRVDFQRHERAAQVSVDRGASTRIIARDAIIAMCLDVVTCSAR